MTPGGTNQTRKGHKTKAMRTIPVTIKNIDMDLLDEQRATLREFLESNPNDHLEGINNLLDHIADSMFEAMTGVPSQTDTTNPINC